MISLSNKAAGKLNYVWADLDDRSSDGWKVDFVVYRRFPMYLIVHEYTLFTLMRRKAELRSIDDIASVITSYCPWYRNEGAVVVGKNSNRRLAASISKIKDTLKSFPSDLEIEAAALRLNRTPLGYLSPRKTGARVPNEAVTRYINGRVDWL